MKQNRILKYGIFIFIFEIIITGIWFYIVRPEPSTALETLGITTILFGINLILGLILYFLKKPSAVLFLTNSILCPIIFYAFWIMWFTYYAS